LQTKKAEIKDISYIISQIKLFVFASIQAVDSVVDRTNS
jgi:hypothetical protein